MSNVLATSSLISKAALAILQNTLGFASNVNRDWQYEFTSNQGRGYSPGETILIRKPPRYTYRAGRVAVPQGTVENTVPLTVAQGGCDLFFTSSQRTLSLQRLEDKVAAAIAPVRNEIDRQGLQLARYSTWNTLGTPGTAPNTQALAIAAIAGINQRMDENAAPRDRQRNLILSPSLNASFIQGMAGMFNGQEILTKQFKSGVMVDSLGLAYAMDQNVDTHTNGAATATNINGANQTGAAITVVSVATGTLTKGTVITLPGVYAVNPQSRQSTGVLAQFIVTSDAVLGATTINISPALVTSGAFQNVTASPTTAQPYVIFGNASASYTTSVGFHKDAYTLAMVPMHLPTAGTGALAHQVTDDGMTLKVTEYYSGVDDISNFRIDVLFGWAATYPELGCKQAL